MLATTPKVIHRYEARIQTQDGGTRTLNLLIRRSGRVVQKRPLRSACWADIPQLSTRGEGRPAAWQ
jgi:DNA-binding winged helix-turn-helix (wHTH) protein